MTSLYTAVSPVVHAAGTELATGRWTFSRTDIAAAADLVPRLQWPADIIDPITSGRHRPLLCGCTGPGELLLHRPPAGTSRTRCSSASCAQSQHACYTVSGSL